MDVIWSDSKGVEPTEDGDGVILHPGGHLSVGVKVGNGSVHTRMPITAVYRITAPENTCAVVVRDVVMVKR